MLPTVRVLLKLLLLNVLAACGAPGSDAMFTGDSTKAADALAARPPAQRQQPRIATKAHGGFFRRVGDDYQFQPCGTKVPLNLSVAPQAGRQLRDRVRFTAVWEGVKMFGVLQGAIVTDTPSTKGAESDSVTPGPRTRFYLVGVDSLRTWRPSDCGGMQLP